MCNFFQRWMHARARRIDREILFTAIFDAAHQRGDTSRVLHAIHRAKTGDPGMEHWRCQCAKEERAVERG